MKQIRLSRLILSTLVISSVLLGSSITAKAEVNTSNTNTFDHLVVTDRTDAEKKQEQIKLNLAKLHAEKTNLTLSRSISWSTILRYNPVTTPEIEKKDYWCGPAAALNAIDTRSYHKTGAITPYSQDTLASNDWLKTENSGYTIFGTSPWKYTMDTYAPGNNYLVSSASSFTDWNSIMAQNVKYTIDNGFPVIIDLRMNYTNGFLTDNYKNSYNDRPRDINHFITIVGYGYENGTLYFRYMDSASYNYGVYTGDANLFAQLSKTYGLIW